MNPGVRRGNEMDGQGLCPEVPMKSLQRFVDYQRVDEITATQIILDRSDTMHAPCGPKSRMWWGLQACAAVRERKRLRHPEDLLGLIIFNEQAKVVWKLMPAAQLPPLAGLASLEPCGFTSISAGLRLARTPPPDQVILITDGEHNRGEHPMAVADELKAAGAQIDVIGIGNEADLDRTMLRHLATTDRDGIVHYEFIGDLQLLSGHLMHLAERRRNC
jgi:hypothetical protein